MRPVIAVLAVCLLAPSIASAQEPNLSGRWSGYWFSESSGHTGPLNGKFRQVDDTHYRVVFTGRFFKVIPFRYAKTLEVVGSDGDRVTLAGTSRLPGFGNYEFNAASTGSDFQATYKSRRDRGTFMLRR